MSPALLNILFNAGLALLLVVTIAYCSRLHSKIRQLQDNRGELAEMIRKFDASTERATASLAELQIVSKKIADALQLKIEKANFLADDLAFLIEKSAKLASQLDQLQKQRAEVVRAVASPSGFVATSPVAQPAPSRSGPVIVQKQPEVAPAPQVGPSVASIEAMLHKLAAHVPSSRPAQPTEQARARTNAERELLEALKIGH